MSPPLLPPTTSLLPPSPDLLPTLALLFEPAAAPHIHTLLLYLLPRHDDSSSPYEYYYTNYTTLIAHIRSILLDYLLSPPKNNNNNNNNSNKGEEYIEGGRKGRWEIIREIVNAHPRLGSVLGAGSSSTTTTTTTATTTTTTTTTTTPISELSTKEQGQLQSSSLIGGVEESEPELLGVLNEEYEKKFDGLRFVTFVNGRGRGELVGEMRRRMVRIIGRGKRGKEEEEEDEDEEEKEKEMRVAVGAVCDIAEDRVRKLGVLAGG